MNAQLQVDKPEEQICAVLNITVYLSFVLFSNC